MGFDPERFLEIPKPELICSMCNFIFEDPVECKNCQTNFCSKCIEVWCENKKGCPNGCELEIGKPHKFFRFVLGNLKMTCANKAYGCEVVEQLEKIKKHEETECKYKLVKCKYQDCEVKMLESEIKSHEETCLKRVIVCGNCSEKLSEAEASYHLCEENLSKNIKELEKITCENAINIKTISNAFTTRISELRNEVHYGFACSNCCIAPIIGVRNICTQCENINLCWKCYESVHKNHKFVQLSSPGYNDGVTCDKCFSSPIENIRYKCKYCEDYGNC